MRDYKKIADAVININYWNEAMAKAKSDIAQAEANASIAKRELRKAEDRFNELIEGGESND